MIYLKKLNKEDALKEFEFISKQPSDESGFTNEYFGCTFEEFVDEILPSLLDRSMGINLKEGFVPDTHYFLWDDDNIVGLFRLRHYLNDYLKNGAGHIGYGIDKKYRNKGYATKGLALLIIEASKIIPEDEIYLSVNKDNPASLKVQLNNGAYIHHEDDKEYYTRIKKIKV